MCIRSCLALLTVALFAVLASSCAATLSDLDRFILSEATPQEKSALLTAKGIDLYNILLLEKNDLSAASRVQMFFVNALRADPLNKQAEIYLTRIESFRDERLGAYIKRAQALKDKKSLTDRESFELCRSVHRALELDASSPAALRLDSDIVDMRMQVIQTRIAALDVMEKKLMTEKTQAGVAAILSQSTRLINEISYVDSGNKKAQAFLKKVDLFVTAGAHDDVVAAKAALAKKDWAGAESAVQHAERNLSGLGRSLTPELKSLKYQAYFKWAEALFAQGRYASADVKASVAVAVNSSPEVLDLKSHIFSARTARDFDSDLADALAEIDAKTASGELSDAWGLVIAGLARARTPGSKNKLVERRSTILAKLGEVYSQAVGAYNEEAYEDARDGLRTVTAIAPDYQQAAAYLEKIHIKLRSLEGSD
jgi:hypothetical protein